MKRFGYSFATEVSFDSEVSGHHFVLRALPSVGAFQRRVSETLAVEDCDDLVYSHDNFGNRLQYGFKDGAHGRFAFESNGEILQNVYRIFGALNNIFLYESAFTRASKEMYDFLQGIDFKDCMTPLSKALAISNAVNAAITYESGATDISTSAADVLRLRKGVCQDYAHLLIALCRILKIPARYANGLMAGEGSSHAWVEIYDDMMWRGLDPTNNVLIEYGYIKISHGRDFSDCPLNQGVMRGVANQSVEVKVNVKELP